jgi:hypothetical protein
LLWFGFIGVVRENGAVAYIYSVNYNMKHLLGLAKDPKASVYQINPAFWAGLEIARPTS